MMHRKKFVCFVLCITMIFTLAYSTYAAPREEAGWTRVNSSAYGPPSDYTIYESYKQYSITYQQILGLLGSYAIAAGIGAPFLGQTANFIATAAATLVISIPQAYNSTAIYINEFTYGHKNFAGLYKQHIQYWYFDAARTIPIRDSIEYSFWS